MKNIAIMIKPASSLCNLRCRYCFYHETAKVRSVGSFGVMPEDTVRQVLQNLSRSLSSGDHLSLCFQGGEPTLAGLPWFQQFFTLVKELLPGVHFHAALQTNGMLLSEDWCRFLQKEKVLTGVSLDLLPDVHDYARKDAEGHGTYQAVTKSIRLLEKYRVDYNILCTLTNTLARHPDKVYQVLQSMHIRYVQFTPCLDAGISSGKDPYTLTPERFSSFYLGLLPLWYRELRDGKYRSIKLFDDIVNLLAFGEVNACGLTGSCGPQLVMEADGSAYPCDFYCTDEYRIGSFITDSLETLLAHSAHSPQKIRTPLPKRCTDCPHCALCNGGCKRMQKQVFFTDDTKPCGYRTFLDEALPTFLWLAREERSL